MSCSSSESHAQLACVLFSIIFAGGSVAGDGGQGCSSSCGDIPIKSPFRLENDPARCGSSYYQLACIGNKTLILEKFSGKYYVTNISYETTRIHVVNINSKSSACAIPSWSISDELQPLLHLLPCLNLNPNPINGRFIYIVEYPDWTNLVGIGTLAPSCSFISLVAYGDIAGSDIDVFHKLHNGFWLGWSYQEVDYTVANLLSICLKIASK